jgi:hypothetical protein
VRGSDLRYLETEFPRQLRSHTEFRICLARKRVSSRAALDRDRDRGGAPDLAVGECVTQAMVDGRPRVDAFTLRKSVTASAIRTASTPD